MKSRKHINCESNASIAWGAGTPSGVTRGVLCSSRLGVEIADFGLTEGVKKFLTTKVSLEAREDKFILSCLRLHAKKYLNYN